MMPSPEPGASHGTDDHPIEPDLSHLMCGCQHGRDEPVALCGCAVEVRGEPVETVAAFDATRCVVCWDLARTAIVAQRCERCPQQ